MDPFGFLEMHLLSEGRGSQAAGQGYHMRLEWIEGVPCLVDLGSQGEVLVNGAPVPPRQPYFLKSGDQIQAGNQILIWQSQAAPAIAETPPNEGTNMGAEHFPTPASPTVIAPIPAPHTEPEARLRLVVHSPEGTQEVTVEGPKISLGRGEDNDIVIHEKVVSRRHAQLEEVPGGYAIRDLESVNGLVIEGKKVSYRQLEDGDILWITPQISLTYLAPPPQVPKIDWPATQQEEANAPTVISSRSQLAAVLAGVAPQPGSEASTSSEAAPSEAAPSEAAPSEAPSFEAPPVAPTVISSHPSRDRFPEEVSPENSPSSVEEPEPSPIAATLPTPILPPPEVPELDPTRLSVSLPGESEPPPPPPYVPDLSSASSTIITPRPVPLPPVPAQDQDSQEKITVSEAPQAKVPPQLVNLPLPPAALNIEEPLTTEFPPQPSAPPEASPTGITPPTEKLAASQPVMDDLAVTRPTPVFPSIQPEPEAAPSTGAAWFASPADSPSSSPTPFEKDATLISSVSPLPPDLEATRLNKPAAPPEENLPTLMTGPASSSEEETDSEGSTAQTPPSYGPKS